MIRNLNKNELKNVPPVMAFIKQWMQQVLPAPEGPKVIMPLFNGKIKLK